MLNPNKKFKIILGVALVLLLSLAIFLVINNLSSKKKTENFNKEEFLTQIKKQYEEIHQDSFKVIGEFSCLPVKDQNIPHNDICLFGIKSNEGYYRLQAPSDDSNNVVNKIKIGQKVEISGELIKEESEVYQTLGTIKVLGIKYLSTETENLSAGLPETFRADYISFSNYNFNTFKAEEYPKLESWVENGEIECNETPLESSLPLRVNKKEINGQKYCVIASSEGAAGSVYTQYAYTTVTDGQVYSIIFLARYVNCSNYPDQKWQECEAERESLNLDNLVDLEVRKR